MISQVRHPKLEQGQVVEPRELSPLYLPPLQGPPRWTREVTSPGDCLPLRFPSLSNWVFSWLPWMHQPYSFPVETPLGKPPPGGHESLLTLDNNCVLPLLLGKNGINRTHPGARAPPRDQQSRERDHLCLPCSLAVYVSLKSEMFILLYPN